MFFFFNDTATTEIYTLSLHDALPILRVEGFWGPMQIAAHVREVRSGGDRKSTRLNSSHDQISYAVFCLKKKSIVADAIVGSKPLRSGSIDPGEWDDRHSSEIGPDPTE